MNEAQIQRELFKHITARKPADAVIFHVPNGGKRGLIEAVNLKRMGVVPGVPDIIAIYAGEVFGMELKAEGGALTEAQKYTLDCFDLAGAHTAVCYGLDQAIRQFEEWGLFLKGKAAA